MGLVTMGVVIYYVVDTIEEKFQAKKAKKLKVLNTNLTDYELQPIEKQILNYDDAVAYFNTVKNSSATTFYDNRSSSTLMFEKNPKLPTPGQKYGQFLTIKDSKPSKKIVFGEHTLEATEGKMINIGPLASPSNPF